MGLLDSKYDSPAPPSSWFCSRLPISWRRWLSVAAAGISVFTMGGLCFGFDSIYPVLYSSGAFVDYCPAEQAAICSARTDEQRWLSCCDSQVSAIVSVTSVSLFGADGVMVLYGELTDRLGPRWCMSVALSLAYLGIMLLAIAGYFAFPMLGLAGPGIFMAVLSFGEAHRAAPVFPRLEPVITPLAASMFDGSAFVFLFWKLLFLHAHVPLFVIAAAWLLLTVAVGGLAWSLLLSKRKTDAMRAEHEARSSELAPVSGMAQAPAIVWHSEGDGLRQLFCRTDTVLLLLFMCTANLNQTFYIETFADQIRALGASAAMLPERAEEIVELFDVIFPLLSLGTTPLAIFLVNRYNAREHVYLGVVVGLSCLFGLAQLIPFHGPQLAAAILFGPARTLQWACYFHYLASPSRYPPSAMGRMVGYANLLIACFGDMPPYLLNTYIQHGTLPADKSSRYVAAHAALMVVVAHLSVALPLQLYASHRSASNRLLQNRGISSADLSETLEQLPSKSEGDDQSGCEEVSAACEDGKSSARPDWIEV
ncbi:hypothetical protein EMIHUDRAFT_198901 [Emiliania huxleyi CCMP1516]|uniref:Major facilitator superfamily (MFS) profile domain-containing protein n=2 Tax=Emiliania huxleyi TaxID=2903 RepID=A0A0D3I1Y9_EMIH1|nr:hypothetical protein EMIHUDRAFT_198901 [Emiliania huxleyi CCMP1516]EOD05274.1 hypothetical protein EMIHUDRAFT_198901 [Emiliania huxleyi CCMP1516]|eukprot:XP_005757703.1 hypothetical protein EMIHUDRAFT_198901 [Emiliania huxleyi CCMP1516]